MKRTFRNLVVIALLAMAILGQHGSASAGGGQAFRFQGESASANFTSVDESGCVVTDVYLWGSEEFISNAPGKPFPSSEAYVFISRYDQCAGQQLLLADGIAGLSEEAFQVDRELETASLNTPITVFEYLSGNWFEVTLDVRWNATGDQARFNDHSQTPAGECVINSRRMGTTRTADVSGTVSDGLTNFTPSPSYYGSIDSLNSGTVLVGCH